MLSAELFNSFGIEKFNVVPVERITALNVYFPTRVVAENGIFGRIEGLTQIVQKQTGWSNEIASFVESPDALKVYRSARLLETDIGGKKALIRNDINWRQTDEFGRTNMQRIDKGLSPITKNGQTIELHHMNQKSNAPLAELTAAEHKKMPHSIRESEIDRNKWQTEKKNYWKARAEIDITRNQVIPNAVKANNELGIKSGLTAAMITGAISTVNNIRDVFNGDISVQEAAVNISVEAGKAAALGYATGFISAEVATTAAKSSHKAIQALGKAGVPAAVVSFGIASYDSVINFAQGEIDGTELALDLGKNATGVAGAITGAKFGAAAGSVVPVVGTIAGGLVGGMVGYAVTTAAYATVIDAATSGVGALADRAVAVAETAGELRDKAIEMGQGVLDFVAANTPEAFDTVRIAMNDLASNLRVPFSFS